MAKSKVVKAVGAAAGFMAASETSRRVEAAMTKAIADAQAQGITDPKKLRKLIREARDKALGG